MQLKVKTKLEVLKEIIRDLHRHDLQRREDPISDDPGDPGRTRLGAGQMRRRGYRLCLGDAWRRVGALPAISRRGVENDGLFQT